MGSKHNASINGRNASIISRKSYVGVVTACWPRFNMASTSSLSCEPGTSGGGGSSSVSETESESTQAGATSTGSEPSLLDRLKAPAKHKRGKLKLGKRESRQKNIAEALAKYDRTYFR